MGSKLILRDLGLTCLSAGLLILSFPSFDLSGLAWVGLVPWLVALEGKKLSTAFWLSALTSLLEFTGIFRWIWQVPAFTFIDYFLLGAYFALCGGAFGLGLNWVRARFSLSLVVVAPPLWTALEYGRAHASFLSAPWMLLGHSQYQHSSLIQISSWTGVYGVSFLIVLMNAGLAGFMMSYWQGNRHWTLRRAFHSVPTWSLLVALTLLAAVWLHGRWVVTNNGVVTDRMRIALVQGNTPQKHKWDRAYLEEILDRHEVLTRSVARDKPVLIVWPETAIPGYLQYDSALKQRVERIATETNSYLLIGSASSAKFSSGNQVRSQRYNSMFLVTPDGRIGGEYRKIMLVPFGEYTPFRGVLQWPTTIASPILEITPGDQYTLFTIGSTKFGVTICWENIFSDHFRQFVRRGASFMVNGTNEGWFGETAAPYQFLAMSVFRAAENRVAIARVANTGISAFIDPYGRIVSRLKGGEDKELFVQGTLISEIPLSNARTFYTVYGDIFAFVMILLSGSMLLGAVRVSLVHRSLASVTPMEGKRA